MDLDLETDQGGHLLKDSTASRSGTLGRGILGLVYNHPNCSDLGRTERCGLYKQIWPGTCSTLITLWTGKDEYVCKRLCSADSSISNILNWFGKTYRKIIFFKPNMELSGFPSLFCFMINNECQHWTCPISKRSKILQKRRSDRKCHHANSCLHSFTQCLWETGGIAIILAEENGRK